MATTFGNHLRRLREKAGLTQEGLARAANLSVSGISKLEHAGMDPSWSTVQALARALGVDCKAFEEVEETQSPAPPRRRKKK
jgi:transcriptional regulator with XRE-family HTH domain